MEPLLEFEKLVALARQDPDAFENYRRSMCQQFIATVPSDHQHRLAAVQHRVEMALRRAKTPLAGLLKISSMMHDSLYQLSSKCTALNSLTLGSAHNLPRQPPTHADIISLSAWKARIQKQPR
jgi:hypothetical protein